ncbi:MAG TPA: hypothetical protein VLF67_03350 [Candidatus Saccharimonas sp.]|nr:hypothetical protein [Candidatus Saccharimonas sp.]
MDVLQDQVGQTDGGQEWARQMRELVPEQRRPEQESDRREVRMMPEAMADLRRWGVSEEAAGRLLELTGAYEYGQVVEKTRAQVERGAYIRGDEVILPGLRDYTDRRGGQCGEIATKLLRDIKNGWLAEVNRELVAAGRAPLEVSFVNGLSRRIFNQPNMNHCWVGLGPAGSMPEEMLVVDGSFREIAAMRESGNIVRDEARMPSYRYTNTAGVVSMGAYEGIYGQVTLSSWGSTVTLGSSSDGKYALGLGFLRNRINREEVVPWVRVLRPDGSDATCMVMPSGQLQWAEQYGIEEAVLREAETVLRTVTARPPTKLPWRLRKVTEQVKVPV